jgi:hypothetical protein
MKDYFLFGVCRTGSEDGTRVLVVEQHGNLLDVSIGAYPVVVLIDIECVPANDSGPGDLGLVVGVDVKASRPASTIGGRVAGRGSRLELKRLINGLDSWSCLGQSEQQAKSLNDKRGSHTEDCADQKNVRSKGKEAGSKDP